MQLCLQRGDAQRQKLREKVTALYDAKSTAAGEYLAVSELLVDLLRDIEAAENVHRTTEDRQSGGNVVDSTAINTTSTDDASKDPAHNPYANLSLSELLHSVEEQREKLVTMYAVNHGEKQRDSNGNQNISDEN